MRRRKMTRIFITVLMIIMAGNVNAASNEALYRDCKAFEDNGFKLKGSSAALCLGYFSATNDLARQICHDLRQIPE